MNLFKVLQGTVKQRRPPRQRPHRDRRAPPPDLDDARQGAGAGRARSPAGDIAAVAKLADTTTGDVLGARGADIDVEPLEPPEPVLAVAIHAKSKGDEDKLANALHRLAGRGPGDPHRAQHRDAPDAALGHGRDAPRHRARAARPEVRRRGRDRGREGRVPRDDHAARPRPRASTRSRPAATASSASRSSASSRSSAAPASSSSTRSSAARSPASSSPRSRRASTRRCRRGGVLRLPRRRREGHLLRRQVPLRRLVGDELQDGGLDSGSRRRWPRPRRSCSSRSASSS